MTADVRCPDCGTQGAFLGAEETTKGHMRPDGRDAGGNVCCYNPNRFTEVMACANGHRWTLRYRVECLCRRCIERAQDRPTAYKAGPLSKP